MTTDGTPRAGFWRTVGRPFRAVGRGARWVWNALGFLDLIATLGRVVGLVVRGVGKVFSALNDLF